MCATSASVSEVLHEIWTVHVSETRTVLQEVISDIVWPSQKNYTSSETDKLRVFFFGGGGVRKTWSTLLGSNGLLQFCTHGLGVEPEVRTFVHVFFKGGGGGGLGVGVSNETNFVRFAGLLRTCNGPFESFSLCLSISLSLSLFLSHVVIFSLSLRLSLSSPCLLILLPCFSFAFFRPLLLPSISTSSLAFAHFILLSSYNLLWLN